MSLPKESLSQLGNEIDRIIIQFNSGLHSSPNASKLNGAFTSLVIWVAAVIQLSPDKARKPYLAYEANLKKFMDDVLAQQ